MLKDWRDKPHVLIVDDDDDFASDLRVMLSSEFEIETVASTEEASKRVGRSCPDCILLDLHMPEYFGDNPEMEGFSFLGHLRNDAEVGLSATVPVIVLSAHPRAAAAEMADHYGVCGLYAKPPDVNKLKASIWSLLVNRPGGNA